MTAILSSKIQPATESDGAPPAPLPGFHHPNGLIGQELCPQNLEESNPTMHLHCRRSLEVPNATKRGLLEVQEEVEAVHWSTLP